MTKTSSHPAALCALALGAALALTACGTGPTPGEPTSGPTSMASTAGPFVARPTSGPLPPAQAPEAEVLEHYGAEPAEMDYPLVIPARDHWDAPNREAPEETFMVDVARRDEGTRRLMSYDEVIFVALRDMFTWDANVDTPQGLAAKSATWFVEEADPVLPEEITSRWPEFMSHGTRSQMQSARDASEWGTPADDRSVAYRAVEVTVRLTDRDGAERVEQWIAFITLTTSGKSPAVGAKLIMNYRLALS